MVKKEDYFSWTDRRVARLRELWPTNSATVIAAELGCSSRNVILSKAARMKLPPKKKSNRKTRETEPQTEPREREVNYNPARRSDKINGGELLYFGDPPPLPDGEEPVTILTVTEHQCKFGLGDVDHPEFRFCGAPVDDVLNSYCQRHMRVCYQPRSS